MAARGAGARARGAGGAGDKKDAPKRALLIIDVQNDFVDEGGGLPVPSGRAIIPVINHMRRTKSFDLVILALDWHPYNHCSFVTNNPVRGAALTRSEVRGRGRQASRGGYPPSGRTRPQQRTRDAAARQPPCAPRAATGTPSERLVLRQIP